MIRILAWVALLLSVMAAMSAEARDSRFAIGDRTFLFSLPAAFCDLQASGTDVPDGLRQDLDQISARRMTLKVVAVPCQRIEGLQQALRTGDPVRVLVLGLLAVDGQEMAADGVGNAFWQALWGTARYYRIVAGDDGLLHQLRQQLQRQAIAFDLDAIDVAVVENRIDVELSGRPQRWGDAESLGVAAITEPVSGHFLVASVIQSASLERVPPTIADVLAMRQQLGEVD